MSVDLLKFWESMPAMDIEESRRVKQAASAPPAVTIGQVSGDVITVNVMPGASVDLSRLRARRRSHK